MTSEEIWRPVAGWESFYEVSDHGRVRARPRPDAVQAKRRSEYTMLKGATGRHNMRYVQFRALNDQPSELKRVDALVANAFIGPQPSPQHQIVHLDDDHLNCRIDNLEWRKPDVMTVEDVAIDETRLVGIRHYSTNTVDLLSFVHDSVQEKGQVAVHQNLLDNAIFWALGISIPYEPNARARTVRKALSTVKVQVRVLDLIARLCRVIGTEDLESWCGTPGRELDEVLDAVEQAIREARDEQTALG